MTAGDTIFKLAEQSEGLINIEDIWPLGCSNPLCDTGVFLVKGPAPDGVVEHESGFWPATQFITVDEYHEAYSPDSPQGSVFYDILSRALTAAGIDSIPRSGDAAGQPPIDWRAELVAKLVSLQRDDGSFVNANGRFWENDPVLATSYSAVSLAFAIGNLR